MLVLMDLTPLKFDDILIRLRNADRKTQENITPYGLSFQSFQRSS